MKALALVLALTLVWDRNKEPDIAGYNLYQGPASFTYTNRLNLGNVASYMVTGMVAGSINYFAVTAINTSGAESDFSNEVSYREPELELPWLTASRENGITISWPSVSGAVYRVVSSADLGLSWYGWVDWTGDLVATNDAMSWSGPTDAEARLFRVVRLR